MEQVDRTVLKTGAERRGGSSPPGRTISSTTHRKYSVLEHGVIYRLPDGVIYRRYLNGNLSFLIEYVHLPEDLPPDHYSNHLTGGDILFVERMRSDSHDKPDQLAIVGKYEIETAEDVEAIDEVEDFNEMVVDKAQEIVDTTCMSFGHTLH